jgi:hypothetical protein
MEDDDFEWDDEKALRNFDKHGVTFDRARLVFSDPSAVGEIDDREDYFEERLYTVGMVEGTLLFVAYTERSVEDATGEQVRIRIIMARRATRYEQDDYFQQNNQGS